MVKKITAFPMTPYDIGWAIRDNVLRYIDNGLPGTCDLIGNFEHDAIRCLKKEEVGFPPEFSEKHPDPETLRSNWAREAYQLSRQYGSVPESAIGQPGDPSFHAINVMTCGSALRTAMENGDVERTAALAVLMAMEYLQAEYCADHEKTAASRDKAQKNGIGKINAQYSYIERQCVLLAKKLWDDDSTKRIGEVVQKILDGLFTAKAKTHPEILIPKDEKIKEWLIEADKKGTIKIPPEARKGGRPKKK